MERAPTTKPAAVWREPVRGSYPDPRLIALPGRERLETWNRGLPPPLTHLTGARPTRFGSGTAEAEMPASGWLASSTGLITGGALAILADIAFGCAVQTELPAATGYTTAELSLSFLRPVRPGATLTAGGQAIHVGRSVGLSEAFVIEEGSERLLAHGTSRLTIFPPLDPAPEAPTDIEQAEPSESDTPDPYRRPPPDGVIPQEVWSELPGAEIVRRHRRSITSPGFVRRISATAGRAWRCRPANGWRARPASCREASSRCSPTSRC